MSLFDNIELLAHVAARMVQETMAREALEDGRDYRPRSRGITWGVIVSAFWKAHGEYHHDKSLEAYQPKETDTEKDVFKRMLSSVSSQILGFKDLGLEKEHINVRILRHILGHIFSWRKNGKFSRRAKIIAYKMGYIKSPK